jgi:hypothetical protein
VLYFSWVIVGKEVLDMYLKLVYYRPEAGITDVRYFETAEEQIDWMNRMRDLGEDFKVISETVVEKIGD